MMGMLFNCCARRAFGVVLFTMQCSPFCLRKNLAKPPLEGTRCSCSMDLPVRAGTGGWPGLETHPSLSLRLVRGGDGNGSSWKATGLSRDGQGLSRVSSSLPSVAALPVHQWAGPTDDVPFGSLPLGLFFRKARASAFGPRAGDGTQSQLEDFACDSGRFSLPPFPLVSRDPSTADSGLPCASQQCHHSGCREGKKVFYQGAETGKSFHQDDPGRMLGVQPGAGLTVPARCSLFLINLLFQRGGRGVLIFLIALIRAIGSSQILHAVLK